MSNDATVIGQFNCINEFENMWMPERFQLLKTIFCELQLFVIVRSFIKRKD